MSIHREASSAVVRPANTCMETRLNAGYIVIILLFISYTAGERAGVSKDTSRWLETKTTNVV